MDLIKDLIIPDTFMEKWQILVDTVAELINVPSGLIMRVVDEDIKVFISSKTEGNPYEPGDSEILANSGLYCETVLKTRDKLHVPNALTDEHWKNNPDVKLNMISYLGLPIQKPDESSFGTICVLDNKENHYSELFVKILNAYKEIIENDLKMIYMNQALGDENTKLTELIDEMHYLRGLLRICANCKKIEDDDDKWINLEVYVERHSEAEFSHGLCEPCAEKLYGDKDWFKKERLKHIRHYK